MKPEIPLAVATPAEAQWVEAELISSLLRTARNTQWAGLLLLPVYVGVLWDDAVIPFLVVWIACALAVAAARFHIIALYGREVMSLGAAEHMAFFARYRALWPVSALVWGLSTLLYFDHAPLTDQFICWLMMAGLAMFSINSLSSHLQTLRAFLDTLALTHPEQNPVVWERAIRKLRAGMMPPPGAPRPAVADAQALAAYLETTLDKAAEANPNPGSVRIHRLNRAEYQNAMRDLFGLDVDISTLLPNDDISEGFDNIASALKVSPSTITAS